MYKPAAVALLKSASSLLTGVGRDELPLWSTADQQCPGGGGILLTVAHCKIKWPICYFSMLLHPLPVMMWSTMTVSSSAVTRGDFFLFAL